MPSLASHFSGGRHDQYLNFGALAAAEQEGMDFRITSLNRQTSWLVSAPHGGLIEPGTDQLAREIAGESLSLYLFEGLTAKEDPFRLHVTSTRFDEPRFSSLAEKSESVCAIHRYPESSLTTFVGGRATAFRDTLYDRLQQAAFAVATTNGRGFHGQSPYNLCNRGRTKAGGCNLKSEVRF